MIIVDLVQSLSILVLTIIFCCGLVSLRRRVEDLESELNRKNEKKSFSDTDSKVKKFTDVTSEEESDLDWLNSV